MKSRTWKCLQRMVDFWMDFEDNQRGVIDEEYLQIFDGAVDHFFGICDRVLYGKREDHIEDPPISTRS